MKLETLEDVLTHEIQDLYSAENQIIEAIPKMAKAATSDKLRKAFEDHLKETEEQAKRLEEAAEILGIEAKGHMCEGMKGLLKEGEKLLEQEPNEVLDAALISAAQRVEHYEIAGYGCALTYAQLLDENEVVEILKPSIEEEKKADELLTYIAEREVNKKAEDEN